MTIFLTAILVFMATVSDVSAAIGDFEIVCGQTVKGQAVKCNTGTHQCVACEHHTIKRRWLRWAGDRQTTVFSCVAKGVKLGRGCSVTTKGGLRGEAHTQLLFMKVAKDEGAECITNNFLSMYTSTCYSCEIVETLSSAFIKAGAKAYDVSKDAANAILVVGMIIWIAIFVLKNISAFTTVEPRKMIQDLMFMLFKIYVAFVIVNSGIPTILHYTMEPLMIAGTDFADAIVGEVAPDGSIPLPEGGEK